MVTVAILGEPIGSALLALLIFQQPLQARPLVGNALLLVGIAVTTLTAVFGLGAGNRELL